MATKKIEYIEEIYLYFDIHDTCICYKRSGEPPKFISDKNDKDIVDKGLFRLPEDYMPLGRTCEMLWEIHRKFIYRKE